MKTKKILKEYVCNVFGFPVKLHNVPVVEICGEEAPDINYKILEDIVLKILISDKDIILTTSHLKFIRQTLNLSIREFATKLHFNREVIRKIEVKLSGGEKENLSDIFNKVEISRIKFSVVEYLNNKNMEYYLNGIEDDEKERTKEVIEVA